MTHTPPAPTRRRLATIVVAALTPAAITLTTLAVHNGRPGPQTEPGPSASTAPALTRAPAIPPVPVSAAALA